MEPGSCRSNICINCKQSITILLASYHLSGCGELVSLVRPQRLLACMFVEPTTHSIYHTATVNASDTTTSRDARDNPSLGRLRPQKA